jgi:hypothetical protein
MQSKYTAKDVERFWGKVKRTDNPDDCWIWQAGFDKDGYGRLYWEGRTNRSNRILWTITFGEIPSGLGVRHKCGVHSCCNPSHLFLGVRERNDLDIFWSHVEKSENPSGCWLWTGHTDDWGYGNKWWSGRTQKAHRVMYEITFGEIPDGLLVLHSCDNPPCVNPSHLSLGTNRDNTDDKIRKGRQSHAGAPKGDDNIYCKITEAQVLEIRNTYKTGKCSQLELAKRYGISQCHVSDIINYKKRS